MNLSEGLRVGAGLPRAPECVVALEPRCFADSFADKPRVTVHVGVRVVSENDLEQAKAEAVKSAWHFYPEAEPQYERPRVEHFNDALIHWGVARGLCDPQDVSRPFLSLDEDNVPQVFAPSTVVRLWDEVVRVSELGNPLARDLYPAERDDLAALLASPAVVDAQTSRMLLWCLRRLRP